MQRFRLISRGIAIATLLCFAAPQAQAIEVYGAETAATQLDGGMIVQVRGGRGGGARHGGGGMHRGGGGMHRGGMHGGGMHRGGYAHRGNMHGVNRYGAHNVNRNVNRNINRNVYRNANVYRGGAYRGGVRYGGWARPGRYYWPVGGAVAAGAALGFVGAAAGPNLCWYYTDPSRRQGFWDACP
jgi:hypothetical protein